MEMKIVQVSHNDSDLHALINKLDEDLFQRYPEDEVFALDFSVPDIKDIVFLVAYIDGEPVGCGAIRPLDDTYVELKRFYVDPTYRRKGIAAAILHHLEERANELKFQYIRLEAGAPQPEAIHFYMKHGYYEIDRYGEYVNCLSSLCYEKKL